MAGASDLNNDILFELFLILAQLDKPTRTSFGWINLTHVCRLWRSVGLDLAPLWANIFYTFASDVACSTMRSRARGIPLTVVLSEPVDRNQEDALIHTISEHIRAIDTISIIQTSYSWVTMLEGKTLPVLRHLSISAPPDKNKRMEHEYRKLGPPLKASNLATAYLKGGRPLRLVAPALASLSLVSQQIDVPSILEVLKGCPALEELTIDSGIEHLSSAHREFSTVTLSRLRTLTFGRLYPVVRAALRNGILAPEDVQVIGDEIEEEDGSGDDSDLFSSLFGTATSNDFDISASHI